MKNSPIGVSSKTRFRWDPYCLMAYLLAALPKFVMVFGAVPLRTNSDELATLASAAYFAGYDWSAVVSNAGYYGFGYYSLFAPLFACTDDPVLLYRTILGITCFVQSIAAILAYYIMVHRLQVQNRPFSCLLAAAVTYMTGSRIVYVYNEHIILLLVWVLAWILLELVRTDLTRRRRTVYTLLLILTLSYGLTIHTRLLVLWIAVACIIVLFFLLYKRWLVSWVALIPAAAAGYVGSKQLVNLLQNWIWNAGSGPIRNATIYVSSDIDLFSPQTLLAMFSIITGQLNTVSFFTGGFVIICVISVLILFWSELRRRINGGKLSPFMNETFPAILVLGGTFLLCIGGTIAGQSLTWLPQTVDAMADGRPTMVYGIKSFTYMRYFAPYVGPVLVAGSVHTLRSRIRRKHVLFSALIASIVLLALWCIFNLPYLADNLQTYEPLVAVGLGKYDYREKDNFLLANYLIAIVLSGIIFWCAYLLLSREKFCGFAGLMFAFLTWQYIYTAIFFDFQAQSDRAPYYDGGYAAIQQAEEHGTLPQCLYAVDGSKATDHQNFYLYQFWLNRYQIQPEVPSPDVPEAIVLCNRADYPALRIAGYSMAQLDEDEWLYVKGETYRQLFETCGYTFDDAKPMDLLSMMYLRSNENDFVAFGPYLSLPAGKYTLTMDISCTAEEPGIEVGYFDLAIEEGSVVSAKQSVYSNASGPQSQTCTLTFTLNEAVTDLEFRLFAASGSSMQLEGITLQAS